MTGTLLEIEGVSRRFGARLVLNEASLRLGPGDRVTVAGRSGEGKTTLLRLIAGLDTPDAGEIRLDGVPASQRGRILLPPWKRRTQMVFQNLGLWPTRTVLANVADVLRAGGVPRAAARERALASLEKVGLAREAGRHPASLSGGEARRLAFARALAPEPGLLLLDEPFSSLDPVARAHGFVFLEEVLAATRAAVILVTHDPAEARALGGKIALLREGRLAAPRAQGEWCASESGFRAALESPMEESE